MLDDRTNILYNGCVTELYHSTLRNPGWLPALARPLENQILLVVAPHAANPLMLELAGRLANEGALRVLDGGNCFNVYPVAKALRRLTPRLDDALRRITLSRAFTCFQLQALLQETPASGYPALVLDLLATFYDESVNLIECRRLLATCLPHLRRLARTAPLIISVKPPPPIAAARQVLLDEVQQAADQCWVLEPVPEVQQQLGLF